jgi:hypothetical protein
MGVVETSPSVPRRDGEGTFRTRRRVRPDRLEWAQAQGARRAAAPPGMRRMRMVPVACASPKPAETSPMPVETGTTPTGKILARKPLQEHSRSCRASGARPAGPLMRPHGKAFATGREERPISRLQHLREPDRYTHRCSGATVGDSHEGPLKNRGESCLKLAKNAKRKANLEPNTKHTQHDPHRSGPRGSPKWRGKAPPRARSALLDGSRPLERGPPHSRAHAPLERGPPRSRFLPRGPAPARAYGHLML